MFPVHRQGDGSGSGGRRTRPDIRRASLTAGPQPSIVVWQFGGPPERRGTHDIGSPTTPDDRRRVIDELAALGAPRPIVVFTGVRGAVDPELTSSIAYATERGVRVSVALGLDRGVAGEAMERLADAGTIAVVLSLHGSTPGIDDRSRSGPGVFGNTMAAIGAARDAGLAVQINTTVSAANVLDLPDLLRTLFAARVQMWSLSFIVAAGRGTRLRPLTSSEEEDVLNWMYDISGLIPIKTNEAPQYQRILHERRADHGIPAGGSLGRLLREPTLDLLGHRHPRGPRHRPPRVNAGNGLIFIDRVGDVFPSGYLPVVVGSIHSDPLIDIYRSAPLLRRLRDPDELGGKCGVCEYREVCGGSRSRAYAASGDPLAEDPGCMHEPATDPVSLR